MKFTKLTRRTEPAAPLLATLFAILFVGLLGGCCSLRPPHPEGPTKAPAPSFKVAVDTRLRPVSNPLPVFKDKAPRPLATLTDGSGKQVDFVENELMVEFATQKELGDFLTQWHGTVLATDYPKTAGID